MMMKTSIHTSKVSLAPRSLTARAVSRPATVSVVRGRKQLTVTANWFNDGKKALAKFQAGDYNQQKIDAELEKLIKDNKVMMFSFRRCPFCLKAKALLTENNIKFNVIEVDEIPDGMAYRAELAERTGRTSVPSIWINGKFIGGFSDGNPGLNPLFQSGELMKLVKA